MREEKRNYCNEKHGADISALDNAELAERILQNVYFAKNAFYHLGEAFDGDDNSAKSTPLWLLDEAQQKMAEVNECLNEILERIRRSNATGEL